jgi:NAD(P)-dependent dehydrogenase (short-subunit alcohol dehydrogenase family)
MLELWCANAKHLNDNYCCDCRSKETSMKNVLITGANRGIGLGHTKAFVALGVHVFATTRVLDEADELKALAEAGKVTVLVYDAANSDGPAVLKKELGDTPIDLLFANAGAMGGSNQSYGSVDVEDVLHLVRVNSLAPLKLVEALADNVAKSQKKLIALQSSKMGSITDNTSGGYYAYRVSKAALNMVAVGLANDLRSKGITVITMHPGWVRTRMGGQGGLISVDQCVDGQQRLFEKVKPSDSGHFFNHDGTDLPW